MSSTADEQTIETFANLLQSGLITYSDLIENGFDEISMELMVKRSVRHRKVSTDAAAGSTSTKTTSPSCLKESSGNDTASDVNNNSSRNETLAKKCSSRSNKSVLFKYRGAVPEKRLPTHTGEENPFLCCDGGDNTEKDDESRRAFGEEEHARAKQHHWNEDADVAVATVMPSSSANNDSHRCCPQLDSRNSASRAAAADGRLMLFKGSHDDCRRRSHHQHPSRRALLDDDAATSFLSPEKTDDHNTNECEHMEEQELAVPMVRKFHRHE